MATGTLIADTLNCASGVFPTHLDTRGKGGYRTVATIAERDAIDTSLKSVGMLVYVQADGKTYKYTSSNTWTEIKYADGIDTSLYQLKSNITDDVTSNTESSTKYPSTKGIVSYISDNYVDSAGYTLSVLNASGTSADVALDDIATGKTVLLSSVSKIPYANLSGAPTNIQTTTNLSTSVSTDSSSNTKYPSVKSVVDYLTANYRNKTTAITYAELSGAPTDLQTTTNLSNTVSTDAASTTKYPSVKGMLDYMSSTYRAKATAITYTEVTGKPTNLQTTDNISNTISTDIASTTKYPSVKGMSDYLEDNYVTSSDYSIQVQSDAGAKTTTTLNDISSGNTVLLTTTSKISYTSLSDKPTIPTVPTSLKNPNAITVTLNSGTTEGTDKFTYDGSAVKTVNITAASVGAATSSHTHVFLTPTATLTATTTVNADKLYVASSSLSSLAITKATESLSANYMHEYKMQFTAGADFTPTFTGFGSGIKWLNGTTPTCASGKTYEINICNDLGIIAEFS